MGSNTTFQPKKFTGYDRDGNGSDEAMFRRHNRWHSRFDQPDPYDGSYNLGDPQSFNRYAYVQNDPVNSVDPLGLDPQDPPQNPPDPNQPPPTTHIDSATGQPTQVPGIIAGGVMINISSDGRSSSVGGTSSGPMEIELGPIGPTGAELVPQDPVPQPHPTPTPQQNPNNFRACFMGWRFTATVDHLTQGSRINGAARVTAQILEIGPPLSLAGDAAATKFKATRSGIGGTTNPYGSGLNFFFRHTADPSVKGSLIKIGTKATPILSGVGALTAGFNLAMAAQCGLGVIQ